MSILVVGSSNTDFSLKVKSLPQPGETVLGNGFAVKAGGKGANQAVAAARLNSDVKFCCKVGDDANGKAALSSYRKEGIDEAYFLVDKEAPSGAALIFVDEKGENSIAVASGANLRMTTSDIDKIGSFSKFDIVLTQLEIPLETVSKVCAMAHHDGAMVVLNPAPAQSLSVDLLSNVDIITPNETEAQILTGVKIENGDDAVAAAEVLCSKGVKAVVITMGKKGAFIFDGHSGVLVPAFTVKAVDTTAAGDVFNGALCTALAEGKNLADAVVFASATSALSVTRNGAQDSAPHREEVEEFLKINNNIA